MQSHIAYAGKLGRGQGVHLRLDRRAATILVAVIAGIYLGASTIAEIDPFYRNAQLQSGDGSSYTINGWRGADAVPPPPGSVAPELPVGSFGSRPPAFWFPRSDYPEPVTYAGTHEAEGAHVEDIAGEGEDCSDCSADAPIAVEPEPEVQPLPAACAEGDLACASGEQGSAPLVDF